MELRECAPIEGGRSNEVRSGFVASCGGKGWSLRMIAKNAGVSTANGARTPENVKAKRERDDHNFTVVFQAMAYYR